MTRLGSGPDEAESVDAVALPPQEAGWHLLANAFVQVDTLKGYRYYDLAGIVMNRYVDVFDEMRLGNDGLTLDGSAGSFRQAQVSGVKVWVHFLQPEAFRALEDEATTFFHDVLRILEVDRLKRVGIRCQFIWPVEDLTAASGMASSRVLAPIWDEATSDATGLSAGIEFHDDDHRVKLQVQSVTRSDAASPTLPRLGIMFDADYARVADGIPIADIGSVFRAAETWVERRLFEFMRTVMWVDGGSKTDA